MANNPGAGNTWRVGAGLRQFAFCKLRYSDKFLFRDLTMASLLLSLTLAKVICEVNSERQVFDTNNNRNRASTELFFYFLKIIIYFTLMIKIDVMVILMTSKQQLAIPL